MARVPPIVLFVAVESPEFDRPNVSGTNRRHGRRSPPTPISSGALRTWKDDKIVDSRLDARTVHGVLSASHGAAAFRFAEYAGPVATFRSNATAYPGNRFDEEPERRRRGITVSG